MAIDTLRTNYDHHEKEEAYPHSQGACTAQEDPCHAHEEGRQRVLTKGATMKKLVLVALLTLLTATAHAGNVHRDGAGVAMQVFTPVNGTSKTHTKADVTYTPSSGTKMVRFQPSAAISYKINGTGTAYPVAANANEGPFGIGNRSGAGTVVSSIVFTGISSAAKTIYIQEQ